LKKYTYLSKIFINGIRIIENEIKAISNFNNAKIGNLIVRTLEDNSIWIQNHFENSALQFASFFATNTKLSQAELEDLKKIVEAQIKKGKS
jgi:BlaI family penicillinase repressor